jgi:flagellar basal body-associated protein FliL
MSAALADVKAVAVSSALASAIFIVILIVVILVVVILVVVMVPPLRVKDRAVCVACLQPQNASAATSIRQGRQTCSDPSRTGWAVTGFKARRESDD